MSRADSTPVRMVRPVAAFLQGSLWLLSPGASQSVLVDMLSARTDAISNPALASPPNGDITAFLRPTVGHILVMNVFSSSSGLELRVDLGHQITGVNGPWARFATFGVHAVVPQPVIVEIPSAYARVTCFNSGAVLASVYFNLETRSA